MTPLNRLLSRSLHPVRDLLARASGAAESAPASAPRIRLNTLSPAESAIANRESAAAALCIQCPDPTAEERARDAHQNRGQWLVRQDRWEDLSAEMGKADAQRVLTSGALSVAELLSFGARADVVQAAEHALLNGKPATDAPLMSGIEALEHVLAEMPGDAMIACVVAQAHMDMGWAWRGTGWDIEIPARNRAAFEAHFDRARDIIDGFDTRNSESSLLVATSCALLAGETNDSRAVSNRYAQLIDLNPKNPRPMRAMGNHLLPRWHGSYQALELEARRTAGRTHEHWGAGAYTWVMLDAIAMDDEACAQLDLPFFIEGLHDIMNRSPSAHTVNLLAAYCANTMGQGLSGHDEADHNRQQIAACADWIVRDHLTELHPMIWAHAARGFDNALRVRCAERFAAAGRDDALRIIAGIFRREIAAGKRVIFTENGSTLAA